jgi:hypothetical protein
MTFIFIHIPKTAGTSFRKAAKQEMKCIWDYGPNSPETSKLFSETTYSAKANEIPQRISEKGIELISGHFKADKYAELIPNSRLIAFVRDPVDRLISEYNHHVRHGGYNQSIEVYCNNAGHHNKQTDFFSSLYVSDFFFVGVTERYSESLRVFNTLSGLSLPELSTNRASDTHRREMEVYRDKLSDELIELMYEKNSQDNELYKNASYQLDETIEMISSVAISSY